MRMLYKLVALLILCGVFQTAFEVMSAVTAYPAIKTTSDFGDNETRAIAIAQQRFEASSRISRWVVKDLLAMPYESSPML